jgi:nucleoside-diphosphate-sugar epimerase
MNRVGRRGAIAITGATGFIGRHLCEHFRRGGWDVRALARRTDVYPFRTPGITLHRCRLPDDVAEDAFHGADVVVHCAYTTRFTDRASAEQVNELGTRRVFAMARAAAVERLVFLSSQSAHEAAESYYGRSKLTLETLCDTHDVVLRPGLVIGRSGSSLFHRMCDIVRRSTVIPLFGGGRQLVQTIHVNDLCRAVESSLARGSGGRYSVSEPRAISIARLFREIAVRLDRRPVFVRIPIGPALTVARFAERLGLRLSLSSENLLGLRCLRPTDTTSDLAALGLTVRTFEESLDEALRADVSDPR